ncbi:acetyl esterase [Paenibacillus uliginis N3/975]|uniref:Acetyl esterase n=1 Tax=Paenibacillus uliginis N3/975 TaxID=1313296 RepID=A0A1X7HNP9_9BACL|nr:alpha/beta hydrolase [Paenibacillus uliginis]SMF89922.1 acetyl esterase [Paenibacillus uliginis N3/975]
MTELDRLEPGIRESVEQFIRAGRPSARLQTFEERRQGYLATIDLAGEAEPVWRIEDFNFDEVQLRIYRPQDESNLPVMIYFHGGCFVSGDLETHDRQMRQLANQGRCLVVAVHYRLAPEHRYPAAHDDAVKAIRIVKEQASAWGGNPDKLTLAGDSAGGHIALVASLRLKSEGLSWIQRLILIYPMLDANGSSKSYDQYGDDYIVTRDMLLSGFEAYFEGNTTPEHPEASPLYRDDLAGLPDTYILTAEFDPLVDEGEELYRRLLKAGVNAQCQRYLGVNHGFFQLGGISPAGRKAIGDVAALMRSW